MLLIKQISAIPHFDENGNRRKSPNGRNLDLFIFKVWGPKAELERYIQLKIQEGCPAKKLRDDEGNVLYFSNHAIPFDVAELIITTNDNIVVDNSILKECESLKEDYPLIADKLIDKRIAEWKQRLHTVDDSAKVDDIIDEIIDENANLNK